MDYVEEDENVKSLLTYGRTTGDQKISLELSAQVKKTTQPPKKKQTKKKKKKKQKKKKKKKKKTK